MAKVRKSAAPRKSARSRPRKAARKPSAKAGAKASRRKSAAKPSRNGKPVSEKLSKREVLFWTYFAYALRSMKPADRAALATSVGVGLQKVLPRDAQVSTMARAKADLAARSHGGK